MNNSSPLDLKITFTYKREVKGQKPCTVYNIQVKNGSATTAVTRRYREFHALHKKLKEKFPREEFQLPPKKWIFLMSQSFIQKRRQSLETYLNQLAAINIIASSFEFQSFLNPQNVFLPALSNNGDDRETDTLSGGGSDLDDRSLNGGDPNDGEDPFKTNHAINGKLAPLSPNVDELHATAIDNLIEDEK